MIRLGELCQVFSFLITSGFFLAPRSAGAAETANLTPLRRSAPFYRLHDIG